MAAPAASRPTGNTRPPASAAFAVPQRELLLLHERAGLRVGQITELYGAQQTAVAQQLRLMDIEPRRGRAPEGWRASPATKAQLYLCGLSVKRVGELYEMSYSAMYSRLLALGVTLRKKGSAAAQDTEQLAKWYSSGLSLAQVGTLAGISGSTVRSRLVAHGTPIRPPSARQKRERPITPADLRMARLYNSGLSIDGVAAEAGRSYGFVRNRLMAAGVTFRSPNATAAGRRAVRLITPDAPLSAATAVALAEGGLKASHVVRLTGRSDKYVRKHLAEARIPLRTAGDRLGIDVTLMKRLYRLTGSSAATGQILHISPDTVLARLREAGADILPQGGTYCPDLDAEPIRITEPAVWEARDHQILARRTAGQPTKKIAAALSVSLREVNEILRVYSHHDRRTAQILRRAQHGEHPGVIAVRMGIRPDIVLKALARARPVTHQLG